MNGGLDLLAGISLALQITGVLGILAVIAAALAGAFEWGLDVDIDQPTEDSHV